MSAARIGSSANFFHRLVLDADTGKVMATPSVAAGTDAGLFDPETANALASAGDQQPSPLFTRIHRTDSALVDNAPTQSGARTMALDTKTHSILLVTARHGTGNAFQVLPNTFVGLVIAKLRPK